MGETMPASFSFSTCGSGGGDQYGGADQFLISSADIAPTEKTARKAQPRARMTFDMDRLQ
jgi:hypothetical protein